MDSFPGNADISRDFRSMTETLQTLPIGKREANKTITRQNILLAAKELFVTKGLEATSMRDLIRQSHLGNGTFYNYFTSKEEIFDTLTDISIVKVRAQMRESWDRHGLGARGTPKVFFEFFKFYTDHPEEMHFISKNLAYVRGANIHKKLEIIRRDIEVSLSRNLRRTGKNPTSFKFVSMAIFAMFFELIAEMTTDPNFDVKTASQTLIELVQGGLMRVLRREERESKGSNTD